MIEHKKEFYDLYSFIFDLPDPPFVLRKKKNLFHGLITGEPWAWRVIGITEKALMELERYDFRRTNELSLRRAHFAGRMETARAIFSNTKIPMEKFFDFFLKTDVTAIGLRSENIPGGPPEIIYFEPELNLFPSTEVGFRHGPSERNYLRELHAAYTAKKVFPRARPAIVTIDA